VQEFDGDDDGVTCFFFAFREDDISMRRGHREAALRRERGARCRCESEQLPSALFVLPEEFSRKCLSRLHMRCSRNAQQARGESPPGCKEQESAPRSEFMRGEYFSETARPERCPALILPICARPSPAYLPHISSLSLSTRVSSLKKWSPIPRGRELSAISISRVCTNRTTTTVNGSSS